ncbi:hypothetical protein BCR34DRAFT_607669 [Clohesyomyces aquaticus]|uniref:Heterokaryon incompatibility domain-containing protein n=1 Tax=Clohesyomyces aquaticus TaxID=1231657 RepID=A0A1Y1YFG8_9PLEO|nr:hypothetical protein BCR34DRAFT_607669 [Clohesyomyces aquaticus]
MLPAADEDLELSMRYNWVDNALYIRGGHGVDWTGGDVSWSMYTTADDPSSTRVHAQAVVMELGPPESFAESERCNQYKRALPYSELPKTINDAFQVTGSMGLEYIWIDSLCIIKDSDEDKQAEKSRMMQIYQNTQFMISSASASSMTQ